MPLREKLESWKKQLLDLGKRNRLINFKETKRSNITITNPGFDKVYQNIVLNEKPLKFPFAKKIRFDESGEEIVDIVVNGDFETNKTLTELQKTLKALRLKAKISIEEQGINTLYLTFGMIKWTVSGSFLSYQNAFNLDTAGFQNDLHVQCFHNSHDCA
jgi:hypothetical protein